jgi:uncharacterized protein involved in exopolysaccharide biosynthesis
VRRYAETFFRYWLIALVPLIVLPLAGYVVVKRTPQTIQASAKMWVEPSPAPSFASYNQYETPAQNEQDRLTQLLQISSFDWDVARGSALYMSALAKQPNPADYLGRDLRTNVQFTAAGDNLLDVSYTYSSRNTQLGIQVVQSLLNVALNQTHLLDEQQAAASISYYQYQLQLAQQNLAQSSQKFARYMAAHHYTSAELNAQMAVDPTLASLYQQVQSDQASVSNIRQQVAALQMQSTASSAPGQDGLRVVDPPSLTIISSKKKEILNLALYLLAGLLLGGGFVVTRTLLDRSLRHADEVPDLLGLPVLAVLPYDPARALPRRAAAPRSNAQARQPLAGLRQIG